VVGDQAILKVGPSEGDCCAHHWLIESPAGETSRGVCQFCGASRQFSNYNQRQTISPARKAATQGESKA
jgi:hypothetical protein